MGSESIAESLRKSLLGMGRGERMTAIEAVKSVVLEAMYRTCAEGYGLEVKACPRCGCVEIVKKGHGADGSQRYLCNGCGRTFNAKTGKVVGMSKLPESTWMLYIQCFADRLSLRQCAARCGVSLPTSLFMRRRLLEIVERMLPSFSVGEGCGCELDETYFPENFKGNHSNSAFEIPRPARKRGGEARFRGLSRDQVCVMTGINDGGDAFLEVSGRGALSASRAVACLRGKVAEGSIVSTDKARAYPTALRELDVAVHRAFASNDRRVGTINRVNSLHSSLELFMAPFRGVATKHLPEYLRWFAWDRVFAAGSAEVCGRLARQTEAGVYHRRSADWWGLPVGV